jgi:ABC-type glycerol-3-phosphate transport system permease component
MTALTQNLGQHARERASKLLTHLVLLTGALIVIFPLYWMVSTSFKPMENYYDWPPQWIPSPVTLEAYTSLLEMYPWGRFIANTLTIAVVAMIGNLLSSTLVAYGFTFFRAPGKKILFFILLGTTMLPGVVTMVPTFILFRQLKWIDTYLPLVVPTFFGSAFHIFLLRQFFRTLPPDLFDAAKIDGCSELGILWRIVLPLSGPVLAAICIFQFQWRWNSFMQPLIYLNSFKKYTVALALYTLRGEPQGSTPTQLMAAGTLMVLPVLILFTIFQRYFIQGVQFSGIKG